MAFPAPPTSTSEEISHYRTDLLEIQQQMMTITDPHLQNAIHKTSSAIQKWIESIKDKNFDSLPFQAASPVTSHYINIATVARAIIGRDLDRLKQIGYLD
jgi:hypothetical protein